jgi:CRP-like cAMP-binding protein
MWPDVTLAFCSRNEPEWLRIPHSGFGQIEALTDMRLRIHHQKTFQLNTIDCALASELSGPDLISEWLLDLHLVRQPVGTDARLAALLRLLVLRFGLRTAQGYQLPFALAHARIAELICATRSTVTRQLVLLRQAGQIIQEEGTGSVLLAPAFVDEGPELRPR